MDNVTHSQESKMHLEQFSATQPLLGEDYASFNWMLMTYSWAVIIKEARTPTLVMKTMLGRPPDATLGRVLSPFTYFHDTQNRHEGKTKKITHFSFNPITVEMF